MEIQRVRRSAIEEVARSKAAFVTGVLLVLITTIPRNYDQLAISEQPLRWIFGPLVFSAGSGTFLFVFVYLLRTALKTKGGKAEKIQGTTGSWIGFMGLFWMTAPVAWLYAIPVEQWMSLEAAARFNIALLAVVAFWRVALMVRVLNLVTGAGWFRCLVVVLLPSSALMPWQEAQFYSNSVAPCPTVV